MSRSHRVDETGPRRLAREAALQVLYALDATNETSFEAIHRALNAYWAHLEGPPEGRAYGDELVRGVMAKRDELDAAVRSANPNWRVERMAKVDRNVLRVATLELVHLGVPSQVAIDEAIELAKRFGTAESSAFVNGTLDKLARAHGKL